MLVLKDTVRGYITAYLIPKEGPEAFAIKSLNRDIGKMLGHKRVILRSDQELVGLHLPTRSNDKRVSE